MVELVRRSTLLFLLCISALGPAHSQVRTTEIFARLMTYAHEVGLHERPFNAIVQEVGLQFLGLPYAAGLLDGQVKETLVVDLTRFDCVLYVEHVLALSLGIAEQDYGYDSFAQRVQLLRYRRGKLDGYGSRLHYFSEWIADNELVVQNITREIGGELYEKSLTFMSEHRASYPRIAKDDSLFRGIRSMEAALKDLEFYHVPERRIRSVYSRLQSGDIVAMSTPIKGLDVVHTGLAVVHADGSVGLLHASPTGGVVLSPDLAAYVESHTAQIGILIARPADPRTGGS